VKELRRTPVFDRFENGDVAVAAAADDDDDDVAAADDDDYGGRTNLYENEWMELGGLQ
jgi:hypothetical protein